MPGPGAASPNQNSQNYFLLGPCYHLLLNLKSPRKLRKINKTAARSKKIVLQPEKEVNENSEMNKHKKMVKVMSYNVESQFNFYFNNFKELKGENKTLRHVSSRQDRELSRLRISYQYLHHVLFLRFTNKEGELPAIFSAHNEETKAVRMKMKQVWINFFTSYSVPSQIQDANRELGTKLKEKDGQLLRLKEVNKELRKINKSSNVQDTASIKANLDEVKTQLAHREKEFKVQPKSLQHATFI